MSSFPAYLDRSFERIFALLEKTTLERRRPR
jgi:hypothetical protein